VRGKRDERPVALRGEDVVSTRAHRYSSDSPAAGGQRPLDERDHSAFAAARRLDFHQLDGQLDDVGHGVSEWRLESLIGRL
jgi:hypothetical protein